MRSEDKYMVMSHVTHFDEIALHPSFDHFCDYLQSYREELAEDHGVVVDDITDMAELAKARNHGATDLESQGVWGFSEEYSDSDVHYQFVRGGQVSRTLAAHLQHVKEKQKEEAHG